MQAEQEATPPLHLYYAGELLFFNRQKRSKKARRGTDKRHPKKSDSSAHRTRTGENAVSIFITGIKQGSQIDTFSLMFLVRDTTEAPAIFCGKYGIILR
jgi:hypothetical protein